MFDLLTYFLCSGCRTVPWIRAGTCCPCPTFYREEWPEYTRELQGKFTMRSAFSREPPYKPDGGKIYVQDLIWEDRTQVADAILNGKGYIYICGDAKSMAKSVEDTLARILGEAKGGSAEAEGAAELKLLK